MVCMTVKYISNCKKLACYLILKKTYLKGFIFHFLNFTADVMKQLGANSIFAVDVGSQDSQDVYNYGDHISGWWLLANKWSPWSETVKVPDNYIERFA